MRDVSRGPRRPKTKPPTALGRLIRRERLKRGWTYEGFGLALGRNKTAAWLLENSTRRPLTATLERVARTFGVAKSKILAAAVE